jgi:Domain of unknown function (DUF1929)/Fibronectin type III domain
MRLKMSPTATLLGLVAFIFLLASCAGPVGGLNDPGNFNANPGVTTVELTWATVSSATGYTLERKEGSGNFQTILPSQNTTSFQDTGLTPNTSYTYRLKAVKGSAQSSGATKGVTTKSQGTGASISTLKPVWLSKVPATFVEGDEISSVKDAQPNVTVSGSAVTMSGNGEAMYYLGGLCTQITAASVSGSGTFRIVGDDKSLWSGTSGAATADLVGKQNVSLVFEGTGSGVWNDVKVYCESTPSAPSATSPYMTGKWGTPFDWGTGTPEVGFQYGKIVPTHAANLPDGTIVTWAAWKETTYGNKPEDPQGPFQNKTAGFVWNPNDGSFTTTNNPTHDMFCSGLAMMADGDVLSAGGGSLGTTTGVDSQRRTSYFDIATKTWAEVGSTANLPLSVQHWYGSAVALPDNRVFVVGGSGGNDLSTSGETRGANRNSPWVRVGAASSLATMFPTESDVNWPTGNNKVLNSNGVLQSPNYVEWGEVRGWYPYLNVAPDGQLFQSGPVPELYKYSIDATGSTITPSRAGEVPSSVSQMRTWGNSIMYDEGKILVTGGSVIRGAGATNTGFTVDISKSNVETAAIPPMRFRRAHQNSVVLPTGDVLMIGGNNSGKQFTDGSGFTCPKRKWANATNTDPKNCNENDLTNGTPSGDANANNRWPTDIDTESVLTPELYSPDKNAWRDLADMTIPRNYHSVGILLKDGRVLAAGGGLCGDLNNDITAVPCNHPNGQVFEPPYLFNPDGSTAKRPVISGLGAGASNNAEATGTYDVTVGNQFSVNLSNLGDGTSITKFSMIKLSAVTHSINTDVRYLEYSTEKDNLSGSGTSYQIKLTSNRNVLTPGYYFLFALNDKGVPSVAQVVQVN